MRIIQFKKTIMTISRGKFIKRAQTAFPPTRATRRSVGYDLYTPINFEIAKGEVACIDTELGVEFPTNCFGKIEGRSCLALKNIFPIGGIIDEDYLGPLKVILKNDGPSLAGFKRGDKIAQLVIYYCTPLVATVKRFNKDKQKLYPCFDVTVLAEQRGTSGFGSSDAEQHKNPFNFLSYSWHDSRSLSSG